MKELTKGYPAKVIILFALPLMLGNIFQQVYNISDSKIVSEFISPDALAAVGATAVISNMVINFINGLTQGFSILIARSFGEKNFRSLRMYVAGTIQLTLTVAVVLTLVGELLIREILQLLNTPAAIFEDACAYVQIIIAGVIFVTIYNMCANILRAVGDSKRPLICLIISIFINIGLDLVFICGFGVGIQGAAYATIIAQALSGVCCLGFIAWKYREIIPKRDEWKLSREQYMNLITVGSSMGMMGCIVNIGTVILQKAINDLGKEYVTAHTSGRRVFDIMMTMIFTIGISMTTYVSQNLGAGKGKRIRQGVRHALVMDSLITMVLILFCYTLGDDVVKWVASTTDETVVSSGILYIRVGVWFFFVLGPLFILRCTLQGLGRKIIPLVSSFLELTVKVSSATFLVPRIGYMGVALTEPISWIIMTIPLIFAYLLKRPANTE